MINFIKEAGFPAIALLLGGGMVLLAIIKNIADATEHVAFPFNPTATIVPSQTLTTASSENKTPTPVPLIPTATSSVQSLTELFCANFYSVMVRTAQIQVTRFNPSSRI